MGSRHRSGPQPRRNAPSSADQSRRGDGAQGSTPAGQARPTGILHDRLADMALHLVPAPRRILGVGPGSPDLLRRLAAASPTAVALVGIGLGSTARAAQQRRSEDERLRIDVGSVEHLRYADGIFDLVVWTASLQRPASMAGLAQCARVLAPGGQLVAVGPSARWLALPSRARRRRRVGAMVATQGFDGVGWHDTGCRGLLVLTATASRDHRPAASRAG